MAVSDDPDPESPSLSTSNIELSGAGIADFLPIPPNLQLITDPGKDESANTLAEGLTLSHALAMDDHGEKGVAQQNYSSEDVADLGWHKTKEGIPQPLVGGLDNEKLWLLIRRFNKQMYHVREVPKTVPGNLDLNIADDEEFSPDKLRANIERLYMTVFISLLGATKHIARLQSWREKRRTAAFCIAYSIAWLFDCITPLLVVTLIILIVYPPSRGLLFPPAPIALVSNQSGGVQKPRSGVLGSVDSATGAPENHKGEAVEQEASNFFNGIASIFVTSATGKHPQGEPDAVDEDDIVVPDASAVTRVTNAKNVAAGGTPSPKVDKTKIPIENIMWAKMRPIMHGFAEVSDTWERVGNALSPTPPFPKDIYRLRLATLLVPLFLGSLFVTSYLFMKGITFAVGFAFFGKPVITRALTLLNRRFPRWQKLLELRNTILKGVPTNAQLTITLLRIGEVNKAPLPPAPRLQDGPPERPVEITDAELRATGAEPPLNATKEELDEAIQYDPVVPHRTGWSDIDATKSSRHGRRGSKILGLLKGTTKSAVKTAIGADMVRAKAGSYPARNRLGAVPRTSLALLSGPVDFKARYNGKKGYVYITTRATIPAVAFSTDVTIEKIGSQNREDLHPIWSIPVGDIKELKKVGGYGWKAKIVVGWSLGREVVNGLEIVDRAGAVWKITALPLRDELFNRLVAMGGQKWESCSIPPMLSVSLLTSSFAGSPRQQLLLHLENPEYYYRYRGISAHLITLLLPWAMANALWLCRVPCVLLALTRPEMERTRLLIRCIIKITVKITK